MADAILLFPPGFSVTDASDDPVSGAVLTFFDAGTSNARTVYSDPSLSTSLGTSVTCNSAGRPASVGTEVLLYASEGNLQVTAKTSAGASLWTFDNVLGAFDTAAFSTTTALGKTPVLTKTGDYTVTDSDRGSLIAVNASEAAITLPSAVTVGDNWLVDVKNIHATATDVTVVAVGGQTIDGETSKLLRERYQGIQLVSNGANWLARAMGSAVNIQVVTGDGTYTPTAGTKQVLVIATGGGGGGGGSDSDGTSVGAGGGGGSGATAITFWNAAELGASAAVAIGAAGTGGNTNGGNGTAGGNTTVNPAGTASTLTANGGALGTGSGVASADQEVTAGGAGGAASNGIINLTGAKGQFGIGSESFVLGGTGGISFWGGGGVGGGVTSGTNAGEAGAVYGAGGGGGGTNNDGTGAAGGAGVIGVAVFIEFIS